MVDVIVEHDYIAKAPYELTIKKGEIIKDVVKKQEGWWEGMLNEKRGIFPDTFVRALDKEPTSANAVVRRDNSKSRKCRVAFSYVQDHEDELNLNVGDIIEVIGEVEEGWWRGVLNGKKGVFPSNFVEEIDDSHSEKTSEEIVSAPQKPPKVLCEVKFPYKAQNEDELSLKEGDIVTVLSQDAQDPGWWLGQLNGQVGVFPDNFVVLIQSGDEKNKSDKKQKHNDHIPVKASSVASHRKSLDQKSDKSETDSSTKSTPPLPSKKPILPIKKSPSGGTSGGGLFSGIRKKLVDAVDGSSSSKSAAISPKSSDRKLELNNENAAAENAFDQVERRPLLSDVRATRAKAPGRRPPSVVFKEGEPGVVNGNTDHSNLDILNELSNSNSSIDQETQEVKPKLREWEKHKAPWLEEMKLNQAKRTSTSPGPEQNKLKLTPTEKIEPDEQKTPKTSKTPTSEPDRSNLVITRNKPVPIPTRPQTIHTTNDIQSQKPTKVGSPVSPFMKTPSPVQKPQSVEKSIDASPGTQKLPEKPSNFDDSKQTVSYKQYAELVERIERLESLLEKQNKAHLAAIEDLRVKLQVETDMRIMLQSELDKVSQCVMQV